MITWIRQLDSLLRGESTRIDQLRDGELRVPILGLAVVIDVLGLIYGACMGVFSLTKSGSHASMQIPASMLKVPALFLLTLIITFPSLYVFNALMGSRLRFLATLRLLIASMAVMLAILSSIGPIVAFFSISTTSYSFMVLLNVAVFGIAGILGLSFLLQTLHRISIAQEEIPPPIPSESSATEPMLPNPIERFDVREVRPPVKMVFRIWLVVFALVGSQMGWVLRPFIGAPGTPFAWFRPVHSNFFEAIGQQILNLFK
ncbi:MAG: hypothetical protein H7Z14_00705 [Anaerolineae bacterium]|nr:hypothetical protein [Phycisphaerae bacterium]